MSKFENQEHDTAHEWADGPAGHPSTRPGRRTRLLPSLIAAPVAVAVLGLGVLGLINAQPKSAQQVDPSASNTSTASESSQAKAQPQVTPMITGAPADDDNEIEDSEDQD